MNTKVYLAVDRFRVPFKTSSIKQLIKSEIARLSKETGLPGDKLPVKFINSSTVNYIGCYSYSHIGDKVISEEFIFNFYQFKDFSAKQIIDVVRHEFSHYIRRMRHGIDGDNCHDTKFRGICGELGCDGTAYHYSHVTKLFKDSFLTTKI